MLTFEQQLIVALAGGFVAAIITTVLNHIFETSRLDRRLDREDQRLEKQWQQEREERREQWAREEEERRRRDALERLEEQFKPALKFADEAARIVTAHRPQGAAGKIERLSQNLWGFVLMLGDDPLSDQLLELLRYARIEESDERWREYQGIVFNTCRRIAEMYEERREKISSINS